MPEASYQWTSANKFSRLDSCENFEYLRDQRAKGFDAIVDSQQHNNGNRQIGDVLLVLQILVSSEKDLELRTGNAKKLAVCQARSTSALNALDLVARKLARKPAREGLIKQDAHPAR